MGGRQQVVLGAAVAAVLAAVGCAPTSSPSATGATTGPPAAPSATTAPGPAALEVVRRAAAARRSSPGFHLVVTSTYVESGGPRTATMDGAVDPGRSSFDITLVRSPAPPDVGAIRVTSDGSTVWAALPEDLVPKLEARTVTRANVPRIRRALAGVTHMSAPLWPPPPYLLAGRPAVVPSALAELAHLRSAREVGREVVGGRELVRYEVEVDLDAALAAVPQRFGRLTPAGLDPGVPHVLRESVWLDGAGAVVRVEQPRFEVQGLLSRQGQGDQHGEPALGDVSFAVADGPPPAVVAPPAAAVRPWEEVAPAMALAEPPLPHG